MIELDILYQDSDLLIINKPSNLLSVPGLSSSENLLDFAKAQFPNLLTVHRLDMDTSGIIIYALNPAAQSQLGRQFEKREVHKQYAARVHGEVAACCGEISLPLLIDWPNRPRQIVNWRDGKKALTYFEVESVETDRSLLRLFPVTGRSHQLRVHCQNMGHPIVGDTLYAPASDAPRLMLHAERIQLDHPRTREPMDIFCPAPFRDSKD